eukprot:1297360-Alexandrium_andersonii.AAC.1
MGGRDPGPCPSARPIRPSLARLAALCAVGVGVWRIQALARHTSTAILDYLQGSHLASLSNVALE